jgi:hypothetical protein
MSIVLFRMAGFGIFWSRVPCLGEAGMVFGFDFDHDEDDFGVHLDFWGFFAGEVWRFVSLWRSGSLRY